jgi:acyl-CoA hydrolase
MEVGVRVDAENPTAGQVFHTASAYLTFVALGPDGRPVPVQPICPETPDELRRFEDAKKRRELRLRARAMGVGR